MSSPDLNRTWMARADAHEARPGALARSSDLALAVVAWAAVAAVLVLAGLVGLTVAHAALTTALNLGPTLDAFDRPGGGW